MNIQSNSKTILKTKISIVFNIIIVILEVIGISILIKLQGLEMFQYYTSNSNILALVSCALMAIFSIKALKNNKPIPLVIKMLKYISALCLTVTFIVVIFVLAPLNEFDYMHYLFENDLLYHHLLCPVLTFVSYVFFEDNSDFTIKNSLIATVPTLFYAIVIIILNIVRIVDGPYVFLHVYEQSVITSIMWFFVIVGSAFLFALLINFLNKRANKNTEKKIEK